MTIEQKISPEEKAIRDKKNKANKNTKFARQVILDQLWYTYKRTCDLIQDANIDWSDCSAVYSWLYYIIDKKKNLHKKQ